MSPRLLQPPVPQATSRRCGARARPFLPRFLRQPAGSGSHPEPFRLRGTGCPRRTGTGVPPRPASVSPRATGAASRGVGGHRAPPAAAAAPLRVRGFRCTTIPLHGAPRGTESPQPSAPCLGFPSGWAVACLGTPALSSWSVPWLSSPLPLPSPHPRIPGESAGDLGVRTPKLRVCVPWSGGWGAQLAPPHSPTLSLFQDGSVLDIYGLAPTAPAAPGILPRAARVGAPRSCQSHHGSPRRSCHPTLSFL